MTAKRIYLGDIELAAAGAQSPAANASARFRGKTAIVTGDSITEKNFRAAANWHDYLRERLGLGTVVNDGLSGTGLTRTYGGGACILDRIDSWRADADLILVMASMNDGGGNNLALPLGSMSDSGRGVSYYADCKAVCEKLLAKYPLTPIGFISAPPRASSSVRGSIGWGAAGWYHGWCLALGEVCAHYSLPFLDIYHASGLRPWLAANNAAYFSCSASPAGDGIHPNAAGQALMAEKIIDFVNVM